MPILLPLHHKRKQCGIAAPRLCLLNEQLTRRKALGGVQSDQGSHQFGAVPVDQNKISGTGSLITFTFFTAAIQGSHSIGNDADK
jgi:hypothetical protein